MLAPLWSNGGERKDALRLRAEVSGEAPGIGAAVTSGPAHHPRAILAAPAEAQAVAP